MGRKAYEPDEKTAEQAEKLAAIGIPQDQIAIILDISESTLKKYYSTELTKGKCKGNVKVATCAFRLMERGNPAMTIFLAKVRLGWRETGDDAPKETEEKTINLVFSARPTQ